MAKQMPTKERVAYTEIGGFLHENAGRATVKTYTSVNEPLRVDAAEKTRQIGRVRVEMHVVEDKSVGDNQIYQKDVFMQQIRDNMVPSGTTESGSSDMPSYENGEKKSNDDLPAWGKVLKNFVDKIADSQKMQWVMMIGIAIIAAAGLVIAFMK